MYKWGHRPRLDLNNLKCNYYFRLWCTLVPNDDEVKLLTASLLAIGHALPLAVLLCLNVLTLFTLSPNDQLLQVRQSTLLLFY